MRRPEFDAVIAGGGLSRLSLAARLATGAWRNRRVLLVDGPAARPHAVCWAFWTERPGLLDAAVSRSYEHVRIHAAGEARLLPLGRYRYQVVRRPDLSRVALSLLDACPAFTVLTGHVRDIRDRDDAAETIVDGQRVRSRWAFDSISGPRLEPLAAAGLAFTGWDVHCRQPAFDPVTPTLFDFRTPQAGTARFVYVLPEDQHRALVELTEFVPRHACPSDTAARQAALDEYVRDVLGVDAYTVLRTESAVLPLRTQRTRRGHRARAGHRRSRRPDQGQHRLRL